MKDTLEAILKELKKLKNGTNEEISHNIGIAHTRIDIALKLFLLDRESTPDHISQECSNCGKPHDEINKVPGYTKVNCNPVTFPKYPDIGDYILKDGVWWEKTNKGCPICGKPYSGEIGNGCWLYACGCKEKDKEPYVTHYTETDGGDWLVWPLNTNKLNMHLWPKKTPVVIYNANNRENIKFYAIKYSDGKIYDNLTGWR